MSRITSITDIVEEVGRDIHDKTDSLEDIPPELADWMDDFGLEEATNPKQTICNLAAFNRLLKITLYRVYQQEGADLDPLSVDQDIYSRLLVALDETGDEAFRENPLDGFIEHIDSDVFEPLFDATETVRHLDSPTNTIGEIFESIVDQAVRRKRGQFRTPVFVAEFMAKWAITAGHDEVLDPGIGAGVLTACMYKEKQAAPNSGSVDEMWGVDVNDLAIVMASTGLKIENGEGSPNFLHQDFMDTVADGSSARISQSDPERIPQMDAIVSNPPYSRSEALDEHRQRYNKIVNSETGFSVSEQAPLFAYFFAHSEQFLSNGGRLAFITSSRLFDTIYGEKLRDFLLDRFAIHAFVFLELEDQIFENADVTPCITLLEKQSSVSNHETAFVRVNNWPGAETLKKAIDGGMSGEVPFGFINRIDQQELLIDIDWRNYIDSTEVDAIPGLTTFSQIADIKRGIATGKNDYFCLSQDEVEEWGLDEKYLSKLIRRTHGFDGLRITNDHWKSWKKDGDEVWLLYCYDEGEKVTHIDNKRLQEFLEYGKEIEANKSYLASNRNPWYAVDRRAPPDIFATYMSKDGFRFIQNKASIRTLNNLHNIYLNNFTDTQKEALLAYLNSSVADEITKHSSRTYARGLHKIEPDELKDIPVIDPNDLDSEEVETMAAAYRCLCEAIEHSDQATDAALSNLNSTIRDVLGLDQISD